MFTSEPTILATDDKVMNATQPIPMEIGIFRCLGIAHACLAARYWGNIASSSFRALYKAPKMAMTAIVIMMDLRLSCVRRALRNQFFNTSAVLVNMIVAVTKSTMSPLARHSSLTLMLCGPMRFPW
jgi:hypothetical protein